MLTPISVPPKPHGDVANAAAAGADDGDGGYGATMRKLEDFFASARFTDAISEFMGQHVSTLQFTPLDKEQPLQNYAVFQQYTAMVEQQLEEFVAQEGMTQEEVFAACKHAQEASDLQYLTCIDFMLATTEYESFMQLAEDYYSLTGYEPTCEAEEWDAPADSDDEEGRRVAPLDAEEEVDIRSSAGEGGAH